MQLKDLPSRYECPRLVGEVLVGDDEAIALFKASSAGDLTTLETMLKRKEQSKIALAKPHRIYYKTEGSDSVLAMPELNLRVMVQKAAAGKHAACVTALIAWGVARGVRQEHLLNRDLVAKTLDQSHDGDFTVLGALADIHPYAIRHYLYHSSSVPERALRGGRPALLEFLLRRGVTLEEFGTACERRVHVHGNATPLGFAACHAGPGHLELLLRHGAEIEGSGALHSACAEGKLDNVEFLLGRGARVDEALMYPLGKRKSADVPMTPMDCAVARGQTLIVQWLQAQEAT